MSCCENKRTFQLIVHSSTRSTLPCNLINHRRRIRLGPLQQCETGLDVVIWPGAAGEEQGTDKAWSLWGLVSIHDRGMMRTKEQTWLESLSEGATTTADQTKQTKFRRTSDDAPSVLTRVAELAAGDTGAQAVIADGNRLVLEGVGKVVFALGHGPDKHANAFVGPESLDVISHAHHIGVETECHLAAVGWEVVGDRVLDDFEQLLLRIDRSNGQFM